MRLFITIAFIMMTFSISAIAVTSTLNNYYVGGQAYDITYNTNADSFADLENAGTNFASISQWWDSAANAASFANGTHNDKPAGLRFAFAESSFSGSATVLYHDASTSSGDSGQVFQTADSFYALSAVAVPAPLPILGILPVVGFLKRMRKRQRA